MRIRVVQSIWNLSAVGGAENLVYQIARSLDPEQFEVVVLSMLDEGSWRQSLKKQGIEVVSLSPGGNKKGYDPMLTYNAYRFIRQYRPHVVHVHLNFNSIIAASLARIPVILRHEHSVNLRLPLRKVVVGTILDKLVDRIIVISNAAADATASRERVDRSKITVLPIGIMPEELRVSRQCNDIRHELGIPLNAKVIISLATLGEVKGHRYLLQAFQQILQQEQDAWLLLVGTGPLMNDLMTMVEQLGIAEHVVFTGLRQDVANLLAASDLFVLASLREGTPLALMEACFMGLPCVVTRVGGIPDMVNDGENALLVSPAQPDEMARAVITLLREPQVMHELSIAAKSHAFSNFTMKRFVTQLEQFYIELLNQKGALTS